MSLTTRLHLLPALVCALTGTPLGIAAGVLILLVLLGRHTLHERRAAVPTRAGE